jgi:O-methyltransferase involved in polyketide biosynthesis
MRTKCDLADDTARRRLLADANARANKLLVLTEGVVPYLSTEEVSSLAVDLRKLDHVRYWLVDYFSAELLKLRQRRIGNRMQNAPFKFAPSDWFDFFKERGWRPRETRYLADEADRLGRRMDLPVLAILVTKARQMFMSKARREKLRKFAGYIMFEPDVLTDGMFDAKPG